MHWHHKLMHHVINTLILLNLLFFFLLNFYNLSLKIDIQYKGKITESKILLLKFLIFYPDFKFRNRLKFLKFCANIFIRKFFIIHVSYYFVCFEKIF